MHRRKTQILFQIVTLSDILVIGGIIKRLQEVMMKMIFRRWIWVDGRRAVFTAGTEARGNKYLNRACRRAAVVASAAAWAEASSPWRTCEEWIVWEADDGIGNVVAARSAPGGGIVSV